MLKMSSDLQLTLTTMCLCPQTVCQHCAHSHKPEIPNPDYRDITTAALSVVCLSAYFSSFFHFFMSSFSLAFPSKHDSVSNNLNLWHQFVCVRVFVCPVSFFSITFTLHLQSVLKCTHCMNPGPSSTSAAMDVFVCYSHKRALNAPFCCWTWTYNFRS